MLDVWLIGKRLTLMRQKKHRKRWQQGARTAHFIRGSAWYFTERELHDQLRPVFLYWGTGTRFECGGKWALGELYMVHFYLRTRMLVLILN